MSSRHTQPIVSVLIVSWNTRESTNACLDSLESGFAKAVPFETIVIDNGSVDGTREVLSERTDLRVILNDANLGFAKAVNQAYAASTGEFLLLLNSDVVAHESALRALYDFLLERPDAAGVAPLFLNPDGSIQAHYYRLPTFLMTLANASLMLRWLPPLKRQVRSYRMLDEDWSEPCRVDQPSASCLLLRRSMLQGSHLLDEGFPIFYNDVVLARELSLRGHSLWVNPESVVSHEHGRSVRGLGKVLRRQHLASAVRYVATVHPRWKLNTFRAVVFFEGLLRYMRRPRRALSPLALIRALSGNPGPLPDAPTPP